MVNRFSFPALIEFNIKYITGCNIRMLTMKTLIQEYYCSAAVTLICMAKLMEVDGTSGPYDGKDRYVRVIVHYNTYL